jgi:hypothetical protein
MAVCLLRGVVPPSVAVSSLELLNREDVLPKFRDPLANELQTLETPFSLGANVVDVGCALVVEIGKTYAFVILERDEAWEVRVGVVVRHPREAERTEVAAVTRFDEVVLVTSMLSGLFEAVVLGSVAVYGRSRVPRIQAWAQFVEVRFLVIVVVVVVVIIVVVVVVMHRVGWFPSVVVHQSGWMDAVVGHGGL